MHGLAVYVKEGLPFARDYLQKTLQILVFSTGFTSISVGFLFPPSIAFFSMLGF